MKKIAIIILLLVSTTLFAKEYRYRYHFLPLPKPNLYIKGKKAVISSNGLTISVEQIEKIPLEKDFSVFSIDPNVFFIYFKIKITNNSGKKVYIDPNFISLVSNKKEYRKPMLYNDLYRALAKKYPQSKINQTLSKYLLDFANPIKPGDRIERYLIFRNFREKVKKAMLTFDAVSIGVEQSTFLIIYSVQGEKFDAKKLKLKEKKKTF